MTEIKFIQGAPPSTRGDGNTGRLPGILATLRAHKMQWALIHTVGVKSANQAIVWKHAAGAEFEFRTSIAGAPKGKRYIYARFIGNGKKP